MRQAYITSLAVSGVKNIKNKIEMKFSNQVKTNFTLEKTNIKAIYGPNGSGKSGIIHAMEIYEKLTKYIDFLSDNINQRYIAHLINNETKKFEICVEFIIFDSETNKVINQYAHEIKLEKLDNDIVIITDDVLKQFKNKNGSIIETEIIYQVKNGIITSNYIHDTVLQKATNLLNKRTFIDIFMGKGPSVLYQASADEHLYKAEKILRDLIRFIFSVRTTTENDDQHWGYVNRYHEQVNKQNGMIEENEELDSPYNEIRLSDHSDRIRVNQLAQYQENVKRLTEFMKLFKPELIKIETIEKQDGETIVIDKLFVYPNHKIHIEFESAGIKKLVTLFEEFNFLMKKRGILFIDELDAKINDVYLIKLIQFFDEYLKGQLVFTTHNVSPMEILKLRKHSIDFMSSKGEITHWIKNGNYSAQNLYRKGLIKNLPFNMEYYDFLGILGDLDDE